MARVIVQEAEETRALAKRLASSLPSKSLLALYGSLGAGKTTFMQGLIRGLCGKEEEVHSPTFVYLHLYHTSPPVFHFDLYRMPSSREFLGLGFDEYFEQTGITAIEWPERIEALLPSSTIRIRFHALSEEKRLIEIEGIEL